MQDRTKTKQYIVSFLMRKAHSDLGFCFGSLVILDVVFRYLSLFFVLIK